MPIRPSFVRFAFGPTPFALGANGMICATAVVQNLIKWRKSGSRILLPQPEKSTRKRAFFNDVEPTSSARDVWLCQVMCTSYVKCAFDTICGTHHITLRQRRKTSLCRLRLTSLAPTAQTSQKPMMWSRLCRHVISYRQAKEPGQSPRLFCWFSNPDYSFSLISL